MKLNSYRGKTCIIKRLFGFKRACSKKDKKRNNVINKWREKYIAGKRNVIYAKQALGDQWNGMVSCMSHKCCTVRGR